MAKEKKWISIFSQSGSEIVALGEKLGFSPDYIFTNNSNTADWHPDLARNNKVRVYSHKGIEETLEIFSEQYDCFVTLHGYLRILSPKICNLPLDIYNGHPGAIDMYPELKGKDPQEKVWTNLAKYTTIGSVVHKVTAVVDDGDIVSSVHYVNRCSTKEELYSKLREASLQCWYLFMVRV